jgi:hypothetical protein
LHSSLSQIGFVSDFIQAVRNSAQPQAVDTHERCCPGKQKDRSQRCLDYPCILVDDGWCIHNFLLVQASSSLRSSEALFVHRGNNLKQ